MASTALTAALAAVQTAIDRATATRDAATVGSQDRRLANGCLRAMRYAQVKIEKLT